MKYVGITAETNVKKQRAKRELSESLKRVQTQSVINGTDKMTMDEINAEIKTCKQETRSV